MLGPHLLRRFAEILCMFSLTILAGCNGGGSSPQDSSAAVSVKLVKSASDAVLEQRLKAELVKRYQRQQIRYHYFGLGTGAVPASAETSSTLTGTAAQADGASAASLPHSETNVQEKGVDEGDLVKTDGNFIYLARGSRFLVLKATPPEQSAIVSDLDLKEPIRELYLDNGRVTIITTPSNDAATGAVTGIATPVTSTVMWTPTGAISPSVTRLYFYDVADPASPLLTARYEFPGTIQGSRRINNTVYVITNHRIDLPNPVSPWDYLAPTAYDLSAFEAASARATEENLKRIDALTIADLLPAYSRTIYTDGVAGTPVSGPVVESVDVSYPESGNGTDLSLVIALDTTVAVPVVTSSGVLSSWCRIYMSQEGLYLTSGNDWFWIEPVAGAALPPSNPEPSTAIHKFSVANGVGKPVYRGSGVVDGWMNDQFSMGEYNGYLRVGTTRGGWAGEGISNQLSVLAEQNGELVTTGKIEKIAPGEKIYSMRFDRDRGYMVTFRRVDPLFTFDLSDPLKPRQAGEIKVSGFATYIHLIGPDNSRLLTVGQSADAAGRVTGNKLQLFDVSNLATPQLLGEYELGSGWSEALHDYHSFLYYEPLGLLAIPYFAFGPAPGAYTSGLRVFEVNGSGFAQRGTIAAEPVSTGYGAYADTFDRAVIIGTDIYAVAHRSFTVAGTALLDIKKRVPLPEGYSYYPLVQPAGATVPSAATGI
ncbi:MAG TPA: beta-propeller domain-containing protein [Dongiaceae bacterium]|nr:beta-propeller domain-containing protein [Dongiaceae bacterium]